MSNFFNHFFILSLLASSTASSCDDFFTKSVDLGGNTARSTSSSSSGGSGTGPTDSDDDGLSNEVESSFLLNSNVADSDSDGFADGLEFVGKLADPLNPNQTPSPLNKVKNLNTALSGFTDSDLDGIADSIENQIGTNSLKADTDEDGYSDALELVAGSDPLVSTSRPIRQVAPTADPDVIIDQTPIDTDKDGLADEIERSLTTNTTSKDSDDDGYSDAIEYLMGSDPNDPLNVPSF